MDDLPKDRLRKAREAAGYATPTDASRAHKSINKNTLISNENGNREISRKAAEKYAEVFGVTAGWLLYGDNDPLASTLGPAVALSGPAPTYAGVVRAGAFLAVDEYFNQDPEGVPDFVAYHPSFKRVRQYAWRASGDSMNEVGIHDGMWIVGADAADYIDQYGEIESGELVVVERTRFQGSEREITVKEVRFYRDRYELHPRSSNPEYKPIIVPHDHGVDGDGLEVKIIGLVLTAYTDLKRRPR